MRGMWFAAALLAALTPVAAQATVAPLTREQRIMMERRQEFESHARTSFGDHGLVEKLREWRKNWGYVIVGEERSKAPPRVLAKDEYGWFEMQPGATRRLPRAVGLELNRLLTSAALWNEQPYNWGQPCIGTPRLFVVAHAGKDLFGRLGCGREGLAASAARIAETLRAPTGARPPILPMRDTRHDGGVPYDSNAADILERLQEKTYAWGRKTLAGFVDPYADNVLVEGPHGLIRGRKAVADWARNLQDWNAPYSEREARLVLHQATMVTQASQDVRYTTHELRWEEEGKLLRQTYSTMWRNNGGLWQIAHERVSEVKPVTDGRPL